MPNKQYFNRLSVFCKDVGHCNIKEETYHICANFLFYTSCFEESLFNLDNSLHPGTLKHISKELALLIDLHEYDKYGHYYCSRYLGAKDTTHYFSQLRLDRSKRTTYAVEVERALREFLKGCNSSDQLWSYLMIAYRFRNNMFHGGKGLINLNQYAPQFELLNRFWDQLLRDVKRVSYKGYNTDKK